MEKQRTFTAHEILNVLLKQRFLDWHNNELEQFVQGDLAGRNSHEEWREEILKEIEQLFQFTR